MKTSRLGDYKAMAAGGSVSINNTVVKQAQGFHKFRAGAEIADPALMEKLVRQRLTKRLKDLAEDRARLVEQVDLLYREEQSLLASLKAPWAEEPDGP